jgi:NAD(P)-dependent dehydrogenase (short-subunit alcohol dehydrogenase family)
LRPISDLERISNQEPGKKVDADDQPRRGLPAGILRNDGGYEPAVAYGQSKTANVLMAVGLNKRLRMRGVESFAVMPGSEFLFSFSGLSAAVMLLVGEV